MDKINTLVNVRERCVKETRERLIKYGFNDEETEDAISAALRVGLLSEERYTRTYIRSKTHAGWGRLKILRYLRENGIEEETIQSCNDEFSPPDDEYEYAMRALKKKQAQSSNPYASYMRRLVNKGFSYEVSQRAVKAYLSQEEAHE